MSKLLFKNLSNLIQRPVTGLAQDKGARGTGEAGMTLIEIIVVLALIGGIMGVVMGGIMKGTKTAKESETQLGFGQLRSSLQMYKLAMNKFPTSEQGLKALVENPGAPGWRGPYCDEEALKDAWHQEVQYESDGRQMKFMSSGDDEMFGTEDDIVWPEPKKVAAQ